MNALLLRTASVPVHPESLPGSPRVSLSRHGSVNGIFSTAVSSPRISTHLEIGGRRDSPIRQVSSESDVIGSLTKQSGDGSRSFPARIPEEEHLSDVAMFGRDEYERIWSESGFSGDGFGKGKKSGGGNGGGNGGGDLNEIGNYYKQMLKSNPGDSLLLRNYGKFLHEVEGDEKKAEEYYGRAILASPGDGEVLSLYGKLIWESQKDGKRAKSYFDQAVSASPNDCMVLGSYAHFMWEVEEDEDDEEINVQAQVSPLAIIAAF